MSLAPILVSTNVERLTIARYKAQMWAKEQKTYVFKWRSKDTKYVNKPNVNDLAKLQQTHAFFWQFFVPGAPAYLNNNVNPDIALVNGSPLITHSLTFEQKSHYHKIIEHINTMRVNGTPVPHGSEILVPQPLAVNVIVQETLDGKPISKKRKQQLDKLRVISRSYNVDPKNRAIIIPLTTAMAKSTGESSSKYFTFCTKNMLSPIAKVHAQEPFPFDLAFAMTVHKAQGRTIKRVVVDLTHHPRCCCCMKCAAIFVAMSRVAETDHIRLLEPDTIYQRESLYSYLSSIQPQKHIRPFLHGYSEDGLPWNPQQALQFSSNLNMS